MVRRPQNLVAFIAWAVIIVLGVLVILGLVYLDEIREFLDELGPWASPLRIAVPALLGLAGLGVLFGGGAAGLVGLMKLLEGLGTWRTVTVLALLAAVAWMGALEYDRWRDNLAEASYVGQREDWERGWQLREKLWGDGREWFDVRLDLWLQDLDEILPPASAQHRHAVYKLTHELYLVQQRRLAPEQKRNECVSYGTEAHRDPTRESSCWSELLNHWPGTNTLDGQLDSLIIRLQFSERIAE